jgi:hypothetical protein
VNPSLEWTAEPFGQPALPPLQGRIDCKTGTAQWIAAAPAKDVTGAIRFEPSRFGATDFYVTDVAGSVAGGRFGLDGAVRHNGSGVLLHSHVKVTNADMPVLLGGVLKVPASGRLTLEADLQGQGLSPASLVGSLTGAGTLTTENVEIAGLNPGAADDVLNALEKDRSLMNNSPRVMQIAGTALDAGKLKIASATTPVVIADGRAQLSRLQVSAQNTDISGLISLALADWQVNARFTMTAPPRRNAPGAERPAMAVTARGPLGAAQRNVEVATLINWVQQRAIDLETKRLDEIEKTRKRVEEQLESQRRQQADGKPSDTGPGVAGPGVPPQTGTVPVPAVPATGP